MRIAIIEDDEITRLELSKLLNTQGYETVLLTDFGNLTDELKQYSIELVLLDINLPYENGYEVCRKIKQVMPVPIIFVTSRDTNADELKSIQVGGIDFITKPYDTLILLEKIKRAWFNVPLFPALPCFYMKATRFRHSSCYENKTRSQKLNLDNKCFQQL